MKLGYSVLGVSLFPESEERCSFGVLHAEKILRSIDVRIYCIYYLIELLMVLFYFFIDILSLYLSS